MQRADLTLSSSLTSEHDHEETLELIYIITTHHLIAVL